MIELIACITSKKVSGGFNIQVLSLRMFKSSGQGEWGGLVRPELSPTAQDSDLDVLFWLHILITWSKLGELMKLIWVRFSEAALRARKQSDRTRSSIRIGLKNWDHGATDSGMSWL